MSLRAIIKNIKFILRILTGLMSIVPFSSYAQKQKTDTVFLLKEQLNGGYHAIFIDQNKNSKYYDRIMDIPMDTDDLDMYRDEIKALKLDKFKHYTLSKHLPRHWRELHSYKNNFYLYSPSEGGWRTNTLVNDSTIIKFTMDGPHGYRIDSFSQPYADKFEFKLTGGNRSFTLVIHVLDRKKQLAVFESKSEGRSVYRLMVGAQHLKDYPIIVNYSTDKQNEFDFDAIDFAQLLKKQGQ